MGAERHVLDFKPALRLEWRDQDGHYETQPRDPEGSVRVALRDVRCPRYNGRGRPRFVALARHPSV